MAKYGALPFCCISPILMLTLLGLCTCRATDEERKVYIVYMGSLPKGQYSPKSHHFSVMEKVLEGSSVRDSLIRSYKRSFNGFAARLTVQEQRKLASMKGVVSVFPSTTLRFQTTRSWDFMGFYETLKRNPAVKSDVIVGVIDSGIWPESESFNDEGFGPVPKNWKGVCKGGKNFICNKKIIGARYYSSSSPTEMSARDEIGHGSHTASTAAGNIVKDAGFYGLAQGTARGGLPSARIAAYKVCNKDSGCQAEQVLAAFDDAIADGVDILAISLGPDSAVDFVNDPIAIGAFHAMQHGILTSHSAGNNGNEAASVASVAPWMLSVAASSIDRRIIDKVVLENGRTLVGNAVNPFASSRTMFPLVYGKASKSCSTADARACYADCLDRNLVRGKIVLCDSPLGDYEAVSAGALGSITQSNQYTKDFSDAVPLPALALNSHDFDLVKSYMNSTKNARAKILKSQARKDSTAPMVPHFSSRGPNPVILDIMKPDISAPGVDILAAYSPIAPPSENPNDKRAVKYNILSGTSMACPHAAGAAAYVKMLHPNWSPSAIKSALMTTAWPMNATRNKDAEFAYGSGHINPAEAANPGLVYDALKADYVNLLCILGIDGVVLRQISGDNSTCPKNMNTDASPKDFNYPSMTATVRAITSFKITFNRTVTNVGTANSKYVARIAANSKIKIKVEPSILSFRTLNEKKSFVVTVVGRGLQEASMVSASLVWSDGTHRVRSPIVLHNPVQTRSV